MSTKGDKKKGCYKSFIANHLTLLNKIKLIVKSEWRDEISTMSTIIKTLAVVTASPTVALKSTANSEIQ